MKIAAMIRASSILAAMIALAFAAPVSASEIFNLQCSVAAKSGPKSYVFHFDLPTYFGHGSIKWVTRLANLDLKYVSSDDKTISGSLALNVKTIGMPEGADTIYFKFYRITGDAEIIYLQKPKTEPNSPPHGFERVMDEFTEKGACVKVDRAF